ncbi:MAG: hypothetical protein OQK07_10730 [Rhodospirillales bacterium]|nr:hypothetical protein [Rhodospirillales bacterium]
MEIPLKILSLHDGEETLHRRSIEAIKSDEGLLRHINMVEKAMDVLNFFAVHRQEAEDEDRKTIRLLGMRLFNGCAAALKLTLAGYYQAAAMILRDMLETIFLLGYFDHDRSKITEWRESGDQDRKRTFAPVKVRMALDEKDGFTEMKRAAEYEFLCEMASHPTFKGFRMLQPTGHDHHAGPFFDFTAMKALIEELAKMSIQAGQNFSPFFDKKSKETATVVVLFMEASGQWLERHFKRPYDKESIDKLKALIATLN